jgi:hypothetical protein
MIVIFGISENVYTVKDVIEKKHSPKNITNAIKEKNVGN